MYMVDFMLDFLKGFILIMMFFIVFINIKHFILMYIKNKRLKFTQNDLKEKRKEIIKTIDEINLIEKTNRIPWRDSDLRYKIINVFSIYNELAFGINEELYDEMYVKMTLGYDMMDFYKRYYSLIVEKLDFENSSSRFMPLELLLKKWDSNDTSYHFNKNRR